MKFELAGLMGQLSSSSNWNSDSVWLYFSCHYGVEKVYHYLLIRV